LAIEVDAAAHGLTTATLILGATLIPRMTGLEIDRTEPDKVENMPKNNQYSKPNQTAETVRFWLSATVSWG